jgi:hypothetical protein
MKAGQKIARGLLLARGDGSKMLDCIEKLLDDVTFAVAVNGGKKRCTTWRRWAAEGGTGLD